MPLAGTAQARCLDGPLTTRGSRAACRGETAQGRPRQAARRDLKKYEEPQTGGADGGSRTEPQADNARVVQGAPEDQAARVLTLAHGLSRSIQHEGHTHQKRHKPSASREQGFRHNSPRSLRVFQASTVLGPVYASSLCGITSIPDREKNSKRSVNSLISLRHSVQVAIISQKVGGLCQLAQIWRWFCASTCNMCNNSQQSGNSFGYCNLCVGCSINLLHTVINCLFKQN